MSLDPVLNFSVVEVSTGYDDSATSIVLANGEGSKLPDPAVGGEYNLVWFDYTTYKNPADDPNVEIVRVTAISTDTLTVTRNQESSGASTKNTAAKTYKMILSLTKKTMDDLDTYMDKLDNIEASADVTDAINIASSIVGVDGKATPIDADTIPTIDSAAASVLKKFTWANIKATLKTYFDALYGTVALDNLVSVAINTSLISDTDNTDDLGSDAKQWKDLYINGIANIDSLVADTADINGGTFDGVVGGTTPADGSFSTMSATGLFTLTSGQIKFPAGVQVSADVNTLDDYEEGAWTPAYEFTSGSVTYSHQVAYYTKIGNMVHITCWLRLATRTTPINTSLTISGLPFTLWANSDRPNAPMRVGLTTLTGQLFGYIGVSTAIISLLAINDGAGSVISAASFLSNNNSEIGFSFSYKTA